jgi:hypothetical protein
MPRTSRGRSSVWSAFLCLIALLATPVAAQQAEPAFRGIGFDERLSDSPILADALRSAKTLAGMPLSVRIVVDRAELERSPGINDFSQLDARIQRYRAVDGIRIYVDLRDVPRAVDALPDWGRLVRAIATRYRGQVRGYVFGIRAAGATRPSAREDGFFIKTTSVNVRAGDAQAATIAGGIGDADAEWLQSLYAEDIAPYVDAIGLNAGSNSSAVLAAIEKNDASSDIVLLGEPLGDVPDAGAQRFVTRHLALIGSKISGATYAGPQPVVAAALAPIGTLRGMFGQEIVALDSTAAAPKLTRGGADVTAEVQYRVVFGVGTLTNYVIYEGGTAPFELTLVEPTGTRPAIVDVMRGARSVPRAYRYDAPKQTAVIELAPATRPQVVDWDTGQISGFVQRDEVQSKALPTVAEIISRHQQALTAQDALLRTYVTNASMDQHFRPNAIEGGFDVITENKMFVEGTQTEWEELSFTLNGTRWGPKRPAFPLLQAEKVLSLPLDLRLDADYRYQLAGVEDVEGRRAFALRFDPVDDEKSLYRGTVWIDRETYRKVKVQTVQTKLVSPILSSEEIQFFGEVGQLDGQPIHLMTRLVGRQIMLIAGRNLMVERGIKFDAFQLNPADFETQRAGARKGDNIMYRDTNEGLRYLAKKDGERVVQEATTSALAGLVGITYDPSYDYPLPLLGVNYLNFNFLGNKDTQAAVVFGGVLALVNVQRAKLIGERVDGSLDLFAIAVKGNDRAYDEAGEIEGQRLNTRPFSTGVNLGWQLGQFQKLFGNYQFRYDAISSTETTAASFIVPVSTITNGLGGGFEWKQAGYAFVTAGMANYRAQWEQWGEPGDYRPEDKTYLKYSASLTKDFVFGFHKIHLNAAYYGGRRLDRFSAYQFGLFDENKVHGVPSSGVRFGELAMFRGSYAFNIFEQHRLEVFFDSAYGRDYRVPAEWRPITGIGIGGNTRGPFNTLLRGDFGKSFLPARYRGAGSIVLQIQVLKPL